MTHPIPTAALDDRLGIVGTSGSGKTYGAGTAVERILARKSRVIIPDPLGVWYGLRLAADGRTASGFDVVIFGGPHGDLAINEHAGALIGETVAGMQESAIIDLSMLGTKAAERRFMLAFLTALYRKASGEPVHLIFDEADLWAPQVIRDRDQEPMKLLGMMEAIVRRGRIKGFIPWLITQRPAVVNKDVLSQVDGLIAFKLTSSQDRKALGDWIEGQADREQGKAILASLPALPRGEAVVWVPGRGVLSTVQFPTKATFDSSRTPKRGEKAAGVELKPIDLGALKDRLASIEAETKANDPRALKAEIARLRSELAKAPLMMKPGIAALEREAEEAERRGYERGHADGSEKIMRAVASLAADLAGSIGRAEVACADAKRLLSSFSGFVETQADEVAKRRPQPNPTPAPTRQPAQPVKRDVDSGAKTKATGGLTGPQLQLLKALAWWKAMHHERPTRTQVAAIAGWKPKGSNLRNRLSELSGLGLVAYPSDGRVSLTAAGVAAAPEPDVTVTLIDSIRAVLTGPQLAIFDHLVNAGVEISRADLADAIGWEPGGSNLRNRLSELSSLEIVEYPSSGVVRLQDWVTE